MYLKSLELHGFKSFPNRTVLNFERGATVIVGPNGSGKSNISDAMRWVLGEISSRNIRGTKMEDVIFAGTKDRRPMGYAEVSVTFDNTDEEHRLDSPYDEITVTRRYYRGGQSDYLINRQPCRLRDIHKLFLNTGVGREGYSIIGQGRIAEILSRKSEDRRGIFEEAAGISKYRVDKEQAERNLANNEVNLTRVRDILFELESRVGPLEKEAEKARKGMEITEQKKIVDVALWLFDTAKLRSDLKSAEEKYALAKNELENVQEALTSLERQRETLREKDQANTLRAESLLTEMTDLTEEMHRLDSLYATIADTIKHSEYVISEARAALSGSSDRETALSDECAEMKRRMEALQADGQAVMDERLEVLAELQQVNADAAATDKDLDRSLVELSKLQNTAVDYGVRINLLEKTASDEDGKGQAILSDIQNYEAKSARLKEERDVCAASAEDFRKKIAEAEDTEKSAKARLDELAEERRNEVEKLGELKVEKNTLLQRVDALRRMEEQLEGYSGSIRYVMKAYEEGKIDRAGKIYGPLSRLLEVKPEYVTAIETALGANIQNIVVDTENTAKAAILYLKKNEAGRATFFPVDAMSPANETEEIRRAAGMNGSINRADRLAESDPVFRGVIGSLLVRTVIFDNIDNASNAARALRHAVRIVTLDGQVINAGGSYTGGSSKRNSGILSRGSDIEQLEKKAEAKEKLMRAVTDNIKAIDEETVKATAAVADAEQNRTLLTTLASSQLSAADRAKANWEANESILSRLREDYESFASTKTHASEEAESLRRSLERCNNEIQKMRSAREEQNSGRDTLLGRKDELTEKLSEINGKKIAVDKDIDALRADIEKNEQTIRDIRTEKAGQNGRITEEERRIEENRKAGEENRRLYEEKRIAHENAQNMRKEAVSMGEEFSTRENELHEAIREKNEYNAVCATRLSKAEARLTALQEDSDAIGSRLYDDYELTYEQAIAMTVPEITQQNRAEYAAIQASCRAKLRAYGDFRPAAIEEYREVKDRYEGLTAQVNDLNASCDELRGVIEKIEEQMRMDFVTAFEAINHNFGIVFSELFGGGQAELSLTDPEDVLTCGIEIKAAPPGKTIKSLALLSGGEQTFVAVALIFAIIKVNPTPFCIFDEIDAALDEVNVYRVAAYIKRLAGESQFILITHRRGMMEVGNRLYGITMPERGVSRAVLLDVTEVEKKKKEAETWDSSKN